ncbi:MAG TPA: twin-arginine translocase TatA/TatE family subunit [Solirubrobacterales bacterium]|nr:twin-arginine translocase TatA/TatE family subunit [Solirubrobacterales bacterium]
MEIMIVLVIALIVFGPKRLPELGKSVGKGIREFRGSVSGEHPDAEETPLVVEQPPLVAHGPATKADSAANSHA